MTKAVLPMEPKDVEELLKPIFSFVRGIEKTEADGSSKNILKLLTSIIDFIDEDNNYKLLADIIQDVQRVVMFKRLTLLSGRAGGSPSTKEICATVMRDQISDKTETEKLSKQRVKTVEDLVVWKTKGQKGNLLKGEKCPLTGFWFWENIAKCNCQGKDDDDEHEYEDEEEDDYYDDDEYDDYYEDDEDDYDDSNNYEY